MRRMAYAASLLALVVTASISWGQDPPPPACEVQIQEQYRQLSTEGLVTVTTANQWGPQLTAIASQLRVNRSLVEIEKSQLEVFKQNLAQLAEQLRLARQQTSSLQAEVERLKGSPPASN